MARLPELTTKETLPPEAHEAFDSIAESRGRVGGPFAMMMHSPEVAARTAHLGAYLRFDSTLADGDRELAIITAAREADCAYEWGSHVRLAREVGVREEAINVVGALKATDELTADEALIVNYGRELLAAHHVSDATFAAARERFGEQGVIELTALLGYYTMVACTLNATTVEPTAGMAALPDRP
jgi:4-carboxymuconolactone decarboxylase